MDPVAELVCPAQAPGRVGTLSSTGTKVPQPLILARTGRGPCTLARAGKPALLRPQEPRVADDLIVRGDGQAGQTHIMHGHFRSPSYIAASCGGAPLSIIRQYIEQQRAPVDAASGLTPP